MDVVGQKQQLSHVSGCFKCFNTVWGESWAGLWEPPARSGIVSDAPGEAVLLLMGILFARSLYICNHNMS